MNDLNLLDLTLATPAENLACDEALLEECEDGSEEQGSLRFWEPEQAFVVVGYANRVEEEVNVQACREQGIPILRRCSGGGTVLQGPGCLNYSLVLRFDGSSELQSIAAANRAIMERNRDALAKLLGNEVAVRGTTDLALRNLKFSGNAQRRKRQWLLFHGTFLLGFDLPQVETFLRFPTKQPDYREGRSHREFLSNISLKAEQVKAALAEVWKARKTVEVAAPPTVAQLVREKYSKSEWNMRW